MDATPVELGITPTEIDELLKLLTNAPHRIASASRDVESAQLRVRPDEDSWSVSDILAHLRACADVWGKSIIAMITQDHPTLRYVSPRTWIQKTGYLNLEFRQSLEAFARQRNDLVKMLEPLTTADWLRGATFTATTRGREQTILSYARRLTEHENEHCDEIEALLKSI